MDKNEVKIGGIYIAKVTDRLVPVRIDSTHSKSGWNATNTKTGKRIHIKSAQRLRGAAEAEENKAPVPNEKKPKRLSALNAAAQVLANADQPMGAKAMIAAMAEQGLWESRAGKTPHATLYAAIHREIARKGNDARFAKVDRGMFAINEAAAK